MNKFVLLFLIDLSEYLAFETETGNQLADWMSWRCNIGKAPYINQPFKTSFLIGV